MTMTLGITTLSITTLSIMTLSVMTFSKMTLGIMTFSITTLVTMTHSIMTFRITIRKCNAEFKNAHYADMQCLRHVSLCSVIYAEYPD